MLVKMVEQWTSKHMVVGSIEKFQKKWWRYSIPPPLFLKFFFFHSHIHNI